MANDITQACPASAQSSWLSLWYNKTYQKSSDQSELPVAAMMTALEPWSLQSWVVGYDLLYQPLESFSQAASRRAHQGISVVLAKNAHRRHARVCVGAVTKLALEP